MTARRAVPAVAPRHDEAWTCGFCGPGPVRPAGVCYDVHGRCRGALRGFVPRTDENPYGESKCACAAAGHHKMVAVICPKPWEEVAA